MNDICHRPGAESSPEPDGGYSREQAMAAAQRCLSTITCGYCEVCQLMCPDMCITRDPLSHEIHIDLNHCKGCGLCVHFCPKGALQMVVESRD